MTSPPLIARLPSRLRIPGALRSHSYTPLLPSLSLSLTHTLAVMLQHLLSQQGEGVDGSKKVCVLGMEGLVEKGKQNEGK